MIFLIWPEILRKPSHKSSTPAVGFQMRRNVPAIISADVWQGNKLVMCLLILLCGVPSIYIYGYKRPEV